ncbi:hypothetical protein VB151_07030 [Xanthomonas fragariae]|uniref:Uncharacterized protein n=1 Tax=Xanthomonas fragariae TaxID=48664 RepID=A0A1Y6GSM5_9XANT|nr:hypothetical protein [Xanthomonas fragariae]ENZ95239.1 hypothetical protein O1K_09007 [Xanthomonas fragariae LMG 25863]MBL9196856.1 hypothetical protein [Xanthomonas fragariae]MBL9221247.1 hypothetical protein [Xanthomonas fragariae]MDM7554356.1 hypothetical protein [Xanthomonas fragariae]MDM7557489.1 hypothetical protein [Xanthomonas fragariae]
MRLGDQSGTNLTGTQSVLAPARLAQYQASYAHTYLIETAADFYAQRHEGDA